LSPELNTNLGALAGILHASISAMENGNSAICKEASRKLATLLQREFRQFL
jgi:hypothetical protein